MLGRDLTRGGDPLVVFRDGSFADGEHYFANRFTGARASRCYVAETGASVDCAGLEDRRLAARELLELSDLIVQGDLLPALTSADGAALDHRRVARARIRQIETKAPRTLRRPTRSKHLRDYLK